MKDPAFPPTRSRSRRAPSRPRLPISTSARSTFASAAALAAAIFYSPKRRLSAPRRLELYLPFEEPAFLEKSVDFANKDWRARYFAAKARAELHVAPRELGPPQEGEDPYERNNRRMLDAAMRFGANKVDFICLWNGEGADGPGGAKHMMEEVRNRGARTLWLDTTQLWG